MFVCENVNPYFSGINTQKFKNCQSVFQSGYIILHFHHMSAMSNASASRGYVEWLLFILGSLTGLLPHLISVLIAFC
jgi:hypothetical protein